MRTEEFKIFLAESGIAPKTGESYVGDVIAFGQFLEEQGVQSEGDLKRFYLLNYKEKIIKEGYAIATINKKINSLQAYNLFLIEKGYMKEQVVFLGKDRVKVASGSENAVEVLEADQIDRLLFFVQQREKVSQRNELKNENGEISFYEHEIPLVKTLLIELGEPYLQKITSKKSIGKTLDECLKESNEFRQRMHKALKMVKGEKAKDFWGEIIEALSLNQLIMAELQLYENVKTVINKVYCDDSTYLESLKILESFNKEMCKWINRNIEE